MVSKQVEYIRAKSLEKYLDWLDLQLWNQDQRAVVNEVRRWLRKKLDRESNCNAGTEKSV